MRFFYSESFTLPLPQGHRFPVQKYEMLKASLLAEKLVPQDALHISPRAEDEFVFQAHTEDYVQALTDGSIDPKDMRRIGFPWSEHIAERGRRTTGGALMAARMALKDGLSGQLAGGTHHAHASFGAGFCIFNDFTVVAKTLLDEAVVDRIAIIDLDVHQGDGNAAILKDDPRIFILDFYGEKNFPFRKVPATLNVPLADNMGDADYLEELEKYLPKVWAFQPDIVLYQAGVDPLKEDALGRLDLTHEGLMDRDHLVLKGCWERGIPCSMAIGGGYANPIEPTVMAYMNTYKVAKSIYGF